MQSPPCPGVLDEALNPDQYPNCCECKRIATPLVFTVSHGKQDEECQADQRHKPLADSAPPRHQMRTEDCPFPPVGWPPWIKPVIELLFIPFRHNASIPVKAMWQSVVVIAVGPHI
jgi:hypothetical protein